MLINWLANALVYWGLSYNTNSLVGDPYLNYFLAATLELIAILSSNYLFDRVGRKWPYAIGHVYDGRFTTPNHAYTKKYK